MRGSVCVGCGFIELAVAVNHYAEFRGGSGTRLELEPLKHAMTVVGFGEGRQLPTAGRG